MGGDGKRWELGAALLVGNEIRWRMKAACSRIEIVGSVRRAKPEVGDVEILFVPRREVVPVPGDLFASEEADLAEAAVLAMERDGTLERRLNAAGKMCFGPQIKLMRHRRSGLPVDLFTASDANWNNYLVCRTGPAEMNVRIAAAARAMGWKWTPYGAGFERADGARVYPVTCERDVFDFVGLPYLVPKERSLAADAAVKSA